MPSISPILTCIEYFKKAALIKSYFSRSKLSKNPKAFVMEYPAPC